MLKMYHNSAGTQEITAGNPDGATGAVTSGDTFTNTTEVFVKGAAGRTYKNVSLTAKNVPSGMSVQYSANGTSGWTNVYEFADGDFQTAVGVHRRIQRTNVTEPIKVPDEGVPPIEHELTFDEYIL